MDNIAILEGLKYRKIAVGMLVVIAYTCKRVRLPFGNSSSLSDIGVQLVYWL